MCNAENGCAWVKILGVPLVEQVGYLLIKRLGIWGSNTTKGNSFVKPSHLQMSLSFRNDWIFLGQNHRWGFNPMFWQFESGKLSL